MPSNNLSPSGIALGLSMYADVRNEATIAKKKAKAAATPETSSQPEPKASGAASGTLNGTVWSEDEGRDVLYGFAKDEGLKVKARDSKAKIIAALVAATAAQA
jgi:spermidine/putrescine-binding protein